MQHVDVMTVLADPVALELLDFETRAPEFVERLAAAKVAGPSSS